MREAGEGGKSADFTPNDDTDALSLSFPHLLSLTVAVDALERFPPPTGAPGMCDGGS